jgi:hypothetical protein
MEWSPAVCLSHCGLSPHLGTEPGTQTRGINPVDHRLMNQRALRFGRHTVVITAGSGEWQRLAPTLMTALSVRNRKSARSPQRLQEHMTASMEPAANCARSGQTAGGTPLLEGFDVRVGEQQCAMWNVGLARLVEHKAQDVLDLRLATAFDVTQHRRRVL